MRLVLDTSLLIDHLRGGRWWKKILNELDKDSEIFISSIVFFELFSGKSSQNPQTMKIIQRLLKNFHKIELDEKIAVKAGELYRDITPDLEVPDYIIAASTLSIGATLLTLNLKHFQQIPGLALYSLD